MESSEIPDQQDLLSTAPLLSPSSAGDDAESWTILDQDPDEVETGSDTQEPAPTSASLLRGASRVQQVDQEDRENTLNDDHRAAETDSDIETIDEPGAKSELTAQNRLDSLKSDGIPVGTELSGEGDQYIWSSDHEEADDPDKVPDLTSQYPPEELPERFSEIVKGQTYRHNRNQHLNMLLSSLLVVVVAAAIGFGIGNFIGWSSRIEIHEQFAEVQDEKLEELTDNLVSCMTGPEGVGGDDQDLDDRVIQHLSEENRRLKEELELVKDGHEMGAAEEMTVILRDRINDLLVANAELEREVARLRYAPLQPEVQRGDPSLEKTKSDLTQTKKVLNEIASENDQLKLAIGKARYGIPPVGVSEEERERINKLKMENDELKTEVERIRNAMTSDPKKVDDSADGDLDVDEGFVDDADVASEASDETVAEPPKPSDTDRASTLFQRAADLLKDWSKKVGRNEWSSISKNDVDAILDQLKSFDVNNVVPQDAADQFSILTKLVADKSRELKEVLSAAIFSEKESVNFPQKLAGKFSKTLSKTLRRLSDILNDDASDKATWESRVHELRIGIEKKWNGLKSNVESFFKRDLKREEKVPSDDELNKKGEDADLDEKEESDISAAVIVESTKNSRKNSKKSIVETESTSEQNSTASSSSASGETGGNTKWIFARAQDRAKSREEEKRSDWLFERAQDRKKFHDLMDADWNTRRFFSKQCEKNGDDDETCVELEEVNVASVNPGRTARGDTMSFEKSKSSNFEKRSAEENRREFRREKIFTSKFDDDDDDDDDDDRDDDDVDVKKKHRSEFRDDFFTGGHAKSKNFGKKFSGKEGPELKSSRKKAEKKWNSENRHHRKSKRTSAYFVDNVEIFEKLH